jgi:hypothetical protein
MANNGATAFLKRLYSAAPLRFRWGCADYPARIVSAADCIGLITAGWLN